jgi:hypothetical protein
MDEPSGCMNLLSHTVVDKPLFPVLIKDPTTGITISIILLALSVIALYKIMVYYGR